MPPADRATPREHVLKSVPPYFDAVLSGAKTFEVRVNDRDFRSGDRVRLREWVDGAFTGREASFIIGTITDFKTAPGYVVFSLLAATLTAQVAALTAERDALKRGLPTEWRSAENQQLCAENAALRAMVEDLTPLARLGEEALLESRDGGSFDGGYIQESAERLGVIEPVTRTERCDAAHCPCAEMGGFPLTCYRDTDATARARARLAHPAPDAEVKP